MKTIFRAFLLVSLLSLSCCRVQVRVTPQYVGVDPRAKQYVDEYLLLSARYHIGFSHNVTLGFTRIEEKHIAGLTYYMGFSREIDIDVNYWDHATDFSRRILVWHELTHAYCGRGHTYGDDKEYSDDPQDAAKRIPADGFYPDGCPVTVMFPSVLPDICAYYHYWDYIKEMFQHCEPF